MKKYHVLVVKGIMFNENPNDMMHCVPLGVDHYKVQVKIFHNGDIIMEIWTSDEEIKIKTSVGHLHYLACKIYLFPFLKCDML